MEIITSGVESLKINEQSIEEHLNHLILLIDPQQGNKQFEICWCQASHIFNGRPTTVFSIDDLEFRYLIMTNDIKGKVPPNIIISRIAKMDIFGPVAVISRSRDVTPNDINKLS